MADGCRDFLLQSTPPSDQVKSRQIYSAYVRCTSCRNNPTAGIRGMIDLRPSSRHFSRHFGPNTMSFSSNVQVPLVNLRRSICALTFSMFACEENVNGMPV